MHLSSHGKTACCIGMILLCLANSCALGEEPRSKVESMTRFAPSGAFATCLVRTEGVLRHENFASLPIYWVLPDPISPRRLESLGVREFAVFAMPSSEEAKAIVGSEVEWAVAVRFKRPLELEEILRRWQESIVPKDVAAAPELIASKIGDLNGFIVPSGSFFPPPRVYGELSFTDRFGAAAPAGISVGNMNEERSFIEGNSEGSIRVTFEGLSERSLENGVLPLGLHLQAFYTQESELDSMPASITLRNPATDLESEPISFGARSFVHQRIDIPRKLKSKSEEGVLDADLVLDFVSSGKLEVVIRAHESANYLGAAKHSVYLRRHGSEYVFLSGNELVITQSAEMLKNMMRAAAPPRQLPDRLGETGGDVVVDIDLKNERQRHAWRILVGSIEGVARSVPWSIDLIRLQGSLDLSGEAAKVTAEFRSIGAANVARREFRSLISTTRADLSDMIEEATQRSVTVGGFLSLIFSGVPMAFSASSPSVVEDGGPKLRKAIENALGRLSVKHTQQTLAFEFPRSEGPIVLSPEANVAASLLELHHAWELKEWERFDLGDEILARATARLPDAPALWIRRGHELAYNTSVRFNRSEDRYAWIRRGIMVLLEGAEQNPEKVEVLWVAAKTLGWKMGTYGREEELRRLFAKDKALHRELAKWIDLGQARSIDQEVDSWLVAKLLFQRCQEQHAKNPSGSKISPLSLWTQPAMAQGEYASLLGELGHEAESLEAWKAAALAFDRAATVEFPLEDGTVVRIDELERIRAESVPFSAQTKALESVKRQHDFDLWRSRCKLESLPQMQAARRGIKAGDRQLADSKPREAFDTYGRVLETLLELSREHPDDIRRIAKVFFLVDLRYRTLAEELKVEEAPGLREMHELIKGGP